MALDFIQDLPNPENTPLWLTTWRNFKRLRTQFTGLYYSSNYASFSSLITDIGTTTTTIFVNSACTISTATVVPSNISIEVLGGGSFTSSNASQITFNGPFKAVNAQVFSGNLVVVFGLDTEVNVRWFGAKGDGVTDDISAIHRAIASGTRTYVPYTLGGYLTSTAIIVPAGKPFYGGSLGVQRGGTKLVKADGNYTSYIISDSTQNSFAGWSAKNFTLSGGTSTTWSDVSAKWAVATHYPFSDVENILVEPASGFIGNGFRFHNDNSATNGGSMGCWQSVIRDCRFVGCVVTAPTNNDQIGIDLYINGGAVKVINTSVNRTDLGAWIRKGENIAFENVNLEAMPTGSVAGKTRAACIIGEPNSYDLVVGFDFKGYVEGVGRGFLIQNAHGVKIHHSYMNTVRSYAKTGTPDGWIYIYESAMGVSIESNSVEQHYQTQSFIHSDTPYYESTNNFYFRNCTNSSGVPQTDFSNGTYSNGSPPNRTNDLAIDLNDTRTTAVINGISNVGGIFNIQVNAHGKAGGDWVWVEGATNYPYAVRLWQISVVDANNFTLDGSSFTGSGAVTGNVWWPTFRHYDSQTVLLTPNIIPRKAAVGALGFADSAIEDNGTNIKLGRNPILNGASVNRILRSIDTDQAILSGGTDGGNASKMTLVGGAHASAAGDIAFESFTNSVLYFDQSAVLWALLGDLFLNTAGKGLILQTGVKVVSGAGNPEGVTTAPAGSLYLNTSGDLYIKTSGSGNTGWVGSNYSASATAGIGYVTGAGGTVTQITSITTSVTLNKISGAITTVSSTLVAGDDATFTLTNSAIVATDVVLVSIKSYGGTADGIPVASVTATAAGSCTINIRNTGAVALDAVIVINFAVMKAVSA